MRDIAEAAGVSAQTVYDSVGSKQVLVTTLNDLIDGEAGIGGIVREAAESHDPHEMAASPPASHDRSSSTAATSSTRSSVVPPRSPPSLTALEEGRRRHIEGARGVVGLLQRHDALRPGIELDEAVENLAALADVRVALVLRESYGWSLDRIESWIADTSRTLLLRDPAA